MLNGFERIPVPGGVINKNDNERGTLQFSLKLNTVCIYIVYEVLRTTKFVERFSSHLVLLILILNTKMDVIFLNDKLKMVPEEKPALPQCVHYVSMFIKLLSVHVKVIETRMESNTDALKELEYVFILKTLNSELAIYQKFAVALSKGKYQDILVTNGCRMRDRLKTYKVLAVRTKKEYEATGFRFLNSRANGAFEVINILRSVKHDVYNCLKEMKEKKPGKESIFKGCFKWLEK